MQQGAPQHVQVGSVVFGGDAVVPMAGPCAIESEEQIVAVAETAAGLGVPVLRGGAFKTRTVPSSFGGLGLDGLRLLRAAADSHGLLTVSEVLTPGDLESVLPYIDIVQVGTRNMQNVPLLRELGQAHVPVLLKRGFGATIDEWLHAAGYIRNEGNEQIILCERGIRTFESATRFTLDIAAVALAHERAGLPVVVDPSHPAGHRRLVRTLTLAAVAAGADGLLIEVHPDPENALSDGAQQVTFDQLGELLEASWSVARGVGRYLMGDPTAVAQ
jgi:3-deoxy-7-phosphoheptulonate synthase